MATTDLVVVLPGITGSTLLRDQKPVWAVTAGTLAASILHLGRQLDTLRLPKDIGDDHPNDGVVAGELMPTLHGIPGLWTPVKGYTELLNHLRRLGYRETRDGQPGNLLPYPYDWRLSNRYTARQMKPNIERALDRWRGRGGAYTAARLVFICHSMGGLVARWYIEREGGAQLTRKLVTLGTPYRGAATALDQLINGVPRKLFGLGPDLTPLVRSMPAMYQLVPEYACISRGTDLLKPTETTLPIENEATLTDAAAFHTDLQTTEQARGEAVTEMTHTIVGIRQTTTSTIDAISNGPIDRYGPYHLFGDGTVPLPGAVRAGIPLDSNLIRRVADKHGNLHRNQGALDEIEGILTGQNVIVRGEKPVQPRVDVPDLVAPGETIDVTVDLGANHAVRLVLRDENGDEIDTQFPRPQGGVARGSFDGQPPGGYTIDLTGLNEYGLVNPVSSDLIVLPPA